MWVDVGFWMVVALPLVLLMWWLMSLRERIWIFPFGVGWNREVVVLLLIAGLRISANVLGFV